MGTAVHAYESEHRIGITSALIGPHVLLTLVAPQFGGVCILTILADLSKPFRYALAAGKYTSTSAK